jgi:hypothetical protein
VTLAGMGNECSPGPGERFLSAELPMEIVVTALGECCKVIMSPIRAAVRGSHGGVN